MIEPFIKQLSQEMELEGSLATQVAGVFALPLEENMSVTITDRPPGFSLLCSFSPVPGKNEEAYLTRVMLGNLFGQGTKGAVLGINAEGNMLTLSQTIEYNINYKDFRDVVEDFVNSVDFWREEVQKYM
ncbi:MAG: type III secretion system chaperone [Parachlamydia sp.]|nr:type III secretion system chaperone [Parachlamydia sp.]